MNYDEEFTYDPRIKQLIKDKICAHLYKPTKVQFKKRLNAIIQQNSTLHQNAQVAFWYNDEIYYDTDYKPSFPHPINQLHSSLHSVMDEYLLEQNKINTEEFPYVTNYINQVLNSSDHLPDYFKLFPSSVHSAIRELIDSCPYRAEAINPDKAETIKKKNIVPIELMKQRMLLNLLI